MALSAHTFKRAWSLCSRLSVHAHLQECPAMSTGFFGAAARAGGGPMLPARTGTLLPSACPTTALGEARVQLQAVTVPAAPGRAISAVLKYMSSDGPC